MSGSRSIEHDVISAFNKRNQGYPICIRRKATLHVVVAVKISRHDNFPVPDHLIQKCRIKVIVCSIVHIINVDVVDFNTHYFHPAMREYGHLCVSYGVFDTNAKSTALSQVRGPILA